MSTIDLRKAIDILLTTRRDDRFCSKQKIRDHPG
jgi:hypothetical protein